MRCCFASIFTALIKSRALCAWLLLVVSAASFASASTERQFVSFPAQRLEATVLQLAEKFNLAIIAPAHLVSGLENKQFEGYYTLEECIKKLLHPHQLGVTITDNGYLVHKQANNDATNDTIEEVSVTAFSRSLARAQTLKRNQSVISDAIAAADIAQYPDLNVAESLQRLPGVNITREAGEGRQLSLRGALPDFSLLTLNGMPVLVNNDSPIDSRTQKQRDRSFDLNIFSSSLFNRAEILKGWSAEQLPGGIAGTVALQTTSPMAYQGLHQTYSAQVGFNDLSEKSGGRFSALLANNWGHWGALLYLAQDVRFTEEQGANTFRWRNIIPQGADLSALPETQRTQLLSGAIKIPRGNRYSVWQSQQTRAGTGLSLEYQKNSLALRYDMIYADLASARKEYHLYPRGSQSTPIIEGQTRWLSLQTDTQQHLQYAEFSDARMASESRQQKTSSDFLQHTLHVNWTLSPHWQLHSRIGSANSDFDMPQSDKVYAEGVTDLSLDYRSDPFYLDAQYASNLLLSENWKMHEIDVEEYRANTQNQLFQADLTRLMANGVLFTFGFSYASLKNSELLHRNGDQLLANWQAFTEGVPDGELSEAGILALNNQVPLPVTHYLQSHKKQNWLVFDVPATLAWYGIDPAPFNAEALPDSVFQEQQHGLFAQLQGQNSLLNKPLNWHIGSRYTRISYDTQYATGPQFEDNIHRQWLSHINTTWEWQDNLLLRFGINENFSSPLIQDIAGQPSIDWQNGIISGPNPNLSPYQSLNVDLSLEFYQNDTGMLSLAWYYRQLKDYVVYQRNTGNLADSGLIIASMPEQQVAELTAFDTLTFIQPQNAEQTKVQGLELTIRQKLTQLPGLLSQLGYHINYTYSVGKQNYYNDSTGAYLFRKDLPFLSRHSGNWTLFWETNDLSLRLSSTWRSPFIVRVDSDTLEDEDETGFHGSRYLDFSASWRISEQLSIDFDATNLSNEREEQYSDASNRAYNTTLSGRNFFLGFTWRPVSNH